MLKESLTQDHIAAANSLYRLCPYWQFSTEALDELAARLPGFDSRVVLLKVVAVNALYGTNVMAIIRMAEHVKSVVATTDLETAGPELVETLAALPKTEDQKHARSHFSFASKFANFFIDSERFPIMDQYSEMMVSFHLGKSNLVRDADHRYADYVENIRQLHTAANLTCSSRELDRYLWLAGEYRTWLKKPHAQISTEMRALFTRPSAEIATELKTILT